METKICKVCGKEKKVEDFCKGGYGYTNTCKECRAKAQKATWAKKHSGKAKAKNDKKQEIAPKQTVMTNEMLLTRIKLLEEQVASCKSMKLEDFTPREMLAHLKEQGYKWKEMTFTKVEFVDYNKI